jgi:hypothetical protein
LLAPIRDSLDLNMLHGVQTVGAELLLQEGRCEQALAQAEAATQGPAVPYRRLAWATVARAQLALDRPEAALASSAAAAEDGNSAPNLEVEIDLRNSRARALLTLDRRAEAHAVLRAARAFIDPVAASISAPELRRGFLAEVRAHALLRELEISQGIAEAH